MLTLCNSIFKDPTRGPRPDNSELFNFEQSFKITRVRYKIATILTCIKFFMQKKKKKNSIQFNSIQFNVRRSLF
jgi:hypothetical protein